MVWNDSKRVINIALKTSYDGSLPKIKVDQISTGELSSTRTFNNAVPDIPINIR